MPNDPKMQIFRAAEAPGLMEAACMSVVPPTPLQRDGMDKMLAAGWTDGEQVRVLVNIPGFSLTHVWFKKDYPLPLHSHDAECLYYIIGGSIELGTETLGPRDSFFIPKDGAYTYRPGPEGVELLEIRHANTFDFHNLAKGEGFYAKAVETIAANREAWLNAKMPANA